VSAARCAAAFAECARVPEPRVEIVLAVPSRVAVTSERRGRTALFDHSVRVDDQLFVVDQDNARRLHGLMRTAKFELVLREVR
jgi:hypothetical protein